MTKKDEQFLARVKKEAPEVLKVDLLETAFDMVAKGLIDAPPHPKQKRIALKGHRHRERPKK